jgi:hypothetical protein
MSGADNTPNTVNRFWQLDKTGGGTVTVRFHYADIDVPSNGEADLQPQRWSGGQWEDHPTSCPGSTSNDPANNWGQGTGIGSFSPWTLSSFATPLPIELTTASTDCDADGDIWLTWTTASEINNDVFEIERSIDGADYHKIGEVDGNGNSSSTINYAFEDRNPTPGVIYYRLKQIDFNGEFEYHGPMSISTCENENINVHVSNGVVQLNMEVDEEELLDLNIYNSTGQLVSTLQKAVSPGISSYELGCNLSTGMYVLGITSSNGIEQTIRFVCP